MPAPARAAAAASVAAGSLLPRRADAAGSGETTCPCRQTSPLSQLISNVTNTIVYEGNTWPADFGTGECKAWESGLPPHCDGASAPQWCVADWCYIDPAQCTGQDYERALFFPDAPDAYFSYATCGTRNTFTEWFSGGGSHALSEVTDLMQGYACSLKEGVEDELQWELTTKESHWLCIDEKLDTTCPCGDGCKWHGDWEQCADFSSARSAIPESRTLANKTHCAHATAAAHFNRVAAKEHSDKARIAYAYMGTQADGGMAQYPGLEWCPQDFQGHQDFSEQAYDPRFRGWYAAAASGPKDVVIVFDMSISMTEERTQLARSAGVAILKTFTSADFVGLVAFGKCATSYKSTMVRATVEERHKMTQWVNTLQPPARGSMVGKEPEDCQQNTEECIGMGWTNYQAAFTQTFKLLEDSRAPSSSAWTGCSKSSAVLFMTDGSPSWPQFSRWDNGHYVWLRNLNVNIQAAIFTYSLGSGLASADEARLEKISCENGAMHTHVEDGGNLAGEMAKYYDYYAGKAKRQNGSCPVRWVAYDDASTCVELLGACVALHDFGALGPADHAELFGVACIDANMVAPLSVLRAQAGWGAFWSEVTDQQRACLTPPTAERIAGLQAAKGMSCGSDTTGSAATADEFECTDPKTFHRGEEVSYTAYACTPTAADAAVCAAPTQAPYTAGHPSQAPLNQHGAVPDTPDKEGAAEEGDDSSASSGYAFLVLCLLALCAVALYFGLRYFAGQRSRKQAADLGLDAEPGGMGMADSNPVPNISMAGAGDSAGHYEQPPSTAEVAAAE